MKAQHKSEIHYRGISRALADASVKDGGVAESVNVIVDNEELSPIVPPKVHPDFPADVDYDLLYIHSTSNYANYIGIHDNKLCQVQTGGVSCFFNLDPGEQVLSIKGIGNTLVVATDKKMFYVLYKDQTYKYLGEQVPFPEFKVYPHNPESNSRTARVPLGTLRRVDKSLWELMVEASENKPPYGPGFIFYEFYMGTTLEYPVNQPDELSQWSKLLSEQLWSSMEISMKRLREKGLFSYPILLRYAVRLFDGTYTKHSVPFLIGADRAFISPVTHTSEVFGSGEGPEQTYANYTIQNAYQIAISPVSLYEDMELWSDIIKGIDFFVSEPIHKDYKYNGRLTGIADGEYSLQEEEDPEGLVVNTVLFYRIKTFDIEHFKDLSEQVFDDLKETIKDTDVLRTMPTLSDDYRSHHKLSAYTLFEFNSRLNMANIKCKYYPGPPSCASEVELTTTPEGQALLWTMKFYIKGEDGVETQGMVTYTLSDTAPGPWLVYPDSRCFKVEVYNNGTIQTLPMKEHPLLNCAYYFGGFDKAYVELYKDSALSGQILPVSNDVAYLHNYIMQSEINNVFYFPLTGRHVVPGGKILGVASSTKALSQGQFGQFPLYVFCSDGLWAMETQADGTYVRIAPMSRDVCINPESITGIDGAVIFVTKRGVMLVDGAEVRCISDIMNGLHFRADSLEGVPEAGATFWGSLLPRHASDDLSFIDYISECFIAYDYPNQRLIFVNKDRPYQYIYSIISGTWHKLFAENGLYITRTLNSYPDCYLQARSETGSVVYNFSDIDDVNDSKTRTLGLVISRPLDLDMPGVLKTIMQIKHRGYFAEGSVGMVLLGSRDGRNYARVRSLKSTSYKYYRIALYLNLLPTERISWSEIAFNTKFTNKLR